ncbi:3-methyl-2-oxobutanoate hydroxymethyltransferase [Terasakiella sp. SH-1]|nr:3-methyl-2-oxobutanoate hydroxymethyltransferase [Terasakiella sp. SH-1]
MSKQSRLNRITLAQLQARKGGGDPIVCLTA